MARSLRELRAERQLSQSALAETLGVAPITISGWENHRTRPRDETIAKLAALFEVEPDEIDLKAPSHQGPPIGRVVWPETKEKIRQAALARWQREQLQSEVA